MIFSNKKYILFLGLIVISLSASEIKENRQILVSDNKQYGTYIFFNESNFSLKKKKKLNNITAEKKSNHILYIEKFNLRNLTEKDYTKKHYDIIYQESFFLKNEVTKQLKDIISNNSNIIFENNFYPDRVLICVPSELPSNNISYENNFYPHIFDEYNLLYKYGKDVKNGFFYIDGQDRVLFEIVCAYGSKNVFNFLIKNCNRNDFVEFKNKFNETGFEIACTTGNTDIIKIFLNTFNQNNNEAFYESKIKGLFKACKYNYIKLIKILLKNNVRIDEERLNDLLDYWFEKELCLKEITIIKLLLENLNYTITNYTRDNLLNLLIKSPYCGVTSLMEEKSNIILFPLNLNDFSNEELIEIVKDYNYYLADMLIKKNIVDINFMDSEGNTILSYVSNINFMNFLINHGININAINSKGDNPLFYNEEKNFLLLSAIKANDMNIVNILIEQGADLQAQDEKGIIHE